MRKSFRYGTKLSGKNWYSMCMYNVCEVFLKGENDGSMDFDFGTNDVHIQLPTFGRSFVGNIGIFTWL